MTAPAERVRGGQPTADWMISVIQSPDRASELEIIQRGTATGGLSLRLVSLLDEIIMPERVSNDAETMCGAHARYHQVCGVSCRGLSEGQLGIGCSIPGQNLPMT
jgi:hypothetical protein